jgi:hypothetical protein
LSIAFESLTLPSVIPTLSGNWSRHFDVEDLSGASPPPVVTYDCVDCSVTSPPAETNFTLISARFGWRLSREVDARSGELMFEWRCPECWAQFRVRRAREARGKMTRTRE